VPERRQELTTEGGLDVAAAVARISEVVARLHGGGIQVQVFVDPDSEQIDAALEVAADGVEIHTGRYSAARNAGDVSRELEVVRAALVQARSLGLHAHAGHGLDYRNVARIARIPDVEELNIGHAIIARAVFVGLDAAVREMKSLVATNA
jgi:pyridoxine 5-phosphate synthase